MWLQLALWAGTQVLSFLLTPKPKSYKPLAATDIDAPVAEVGKEIPVLFGTRGITTPNVVWYGDLRTTAIKSGGGGGKKK